MANSKSKIKMSEAETQDYVSDFYENVRFTLPYARRYQLWFFRRLADFLNPQGLILDDGCGTGHLADALPGYKIIGIDLSEKMIEKAKQRFYQAIVSSAENLPFPDNYFDSIFCRSLLHHLPRPELAVAEVWRVLKPGGRVIFSDTLKNPVTSLPRELMRLHSRHFSEDHKNFTEKELLNLVRTKLTIKSKHYIGFLAYTLFGFPDVINFQKFIPFKSLVFPFILALDKIMSRLPVIRNLAANLAVVAEKSFARPEFKE